MDSTATKCYITPMSKIITLREANQGFSRYMREVEAGEEFVITRKGRPVGRLTPIGSRRVLTLEQQEARARTLERMIKGAPLGIGRVQSRRRL